MHIKRNEKLVYILEAVFAIAIIIFALFLTFLAPSIKGYYLVIVLGALLIAAICMLGYRRDKDYLRNYVSRIIVSCFLLTFIVTFMLGLLLNFTRSYFSLNPADIFSEFFPLLLICIETEVLRYVVFKSYYRSKKPVVIFTTITIFMSIFYALNSSSFTSPEIIFTTICAVMLPIIATELLCSYLCYKIGLRPALIYKLCVRLYPFVLPILPNLGAFLFAVLGIVLPAVVFLLSYKLNLTSREDQKRIHYRNRIFITAPIIGALLVIVVLVAGLFKHQIIAIASDSMKPVFERGDAVIIEKCAAGEIKEDDILVFKHEGIIITHRVQEIKVEDDVHYQFVTKGDNNSDNDSFKADESQVIGSVVIVNKYIGFPTVWLNDLFKTE